MEEKEFEGDVKWISPSKIIRENEDDKVGSFFIGLGLIFNDLKDLVLFNQLITDTYRKPLEGEYSTHLGNYAGVILHINRLFASLVNEFFDFLKKNDDVLNSTEFKDILKGIAKEDQEIWNGLVRAANKQLPKTLEFLKTLVRIRGNFTYHYYQSGKVLKKGFISKFYNEQIDERNKNACYSIGETLDLTRFYFSDAAVEEALFIEAGKEEKKKIADNTSVEEYKANLGATVQVIQKTTKSLLKSFLQLRRNSN